LSSHAAVHGAGELPFMLDLVASLKDLDPTSAQSHAQRVRDLSRQQVADMSARYLLDLQALLPGARRILDKMPGNYFRLGLIFLLFPQVRVIHCTRDPMDTCWSCYQQNFEQGLLFTNDLENLGHAYRGYSRLMAHWHSLFPGQITDLCYEDLLNDPETCSRRLLEHCGIEWDPAVLEFHQLRRPVSTASLWQVRQPIYKTSVGRWKAYEEFLQPLQKILFKSE
ncbi:MAG: sulfotransferase, partial [Gammaproteobacteria bacterium]